MNILIVDDDVVTLNLLKEVLERENYTVQLATNGDKAIELLKENKFSIVLSDIRMAETSGIAVLEYIRSNSIDSVTVLMTAFGSVETAVESLKKGAFDYISKPFKLDHLKAIISRAAEHWKKSKDHAVISPVSEKESFQSNTLIGKSPAIVDVYKTLARAAFSDSNVLIEGESGTGKELVAKSIHNNSHRQANPFIAVNCGAIPENLLESELFGHVKGSFTGAVATKKGLFEDADGGIIFLDEIGDIPMSLQSKLLRVLQEREFRSVGSNKSVLINVRVIAATHRDLDAMVKAGTFRQDLYYRLKVISIKLPALRERMEDLSELVGHFLGKYSDRNNKQVSHISPEAMDILQRYPWPGNIRELEHVIERAVAMTRTTIIYPEDFPVELLHTPPAMADERPAGQKTLDDVEKEHILQVLKEVHFNKSKASEILGIDRATLYRKAKRYGIDFDPKNSTE